MTSLQGPPFHQDDPPTCHQNSTAAQEPSSGPPPQNIPYNVIVIDPPWNQGKTGLRRTRPNQTGTLDYPTLSQEELEDFPIPEWSNPEGSFLWIWATNSKDRTTRKPILVTAFELMEHWGFTYYTTVTWNKTTGPCPFGPYQIITEHVLFGYRGTPSFTRECLGQLKTCFQAPPGPHSAKPDAFYQRIAALFPDPRLDVFARQRRQGFDGWGNQYETITTEAPRRLLHHPNQLPLF